MTASTTSEATARDGTRLLTRHWAAAGDPWAGVLIVHGIAEHSGRYEHVGGWLSDAGLDVSSFDLRGFGGSAGRRAFLERWTIYHDDVEDRLAELRAAASGRPVVLFGHSLGGLIVLGYCVADPRRPQPDALILSAPALDSSTPSWMRALAGILTRVAPTFALKNAFDGTVLSRDPTVAEAYLADPLNHHSTTTRLGAEALREQGRARAALARLAIPTLVYHGADDRLVPTVASEPLAAVPVVTRRVLPGLRHESHNEPEGEAVIRDAVAWLRSVLSSADN
ncbi:MAG TPA: alpha/beta hydrolase [Candidatus Limnocylindrales bacterium]|jgi:alpha-beta hydrolase superfamily lysophospholipase